MVKEGKNLLQTNGVLEVHQSSIADLTRVQFIDDDDEVPMPGTPEPEVHLVNLTLFLSDLNELLRSLLG